MPVLDEQVVQGEGQLPVDGRPVRRVGGLDHDRAVQPHLQPEVLADVRVVPVEPGVGELELVGERPADRDRLLGLVRDPVVAVLQPQPVPVHGRLDIAVVAHLHGDLRPLIDVQGRAGDRPVVGEHAQLGAVEALAHRADAQVETVPVVEPDHVGPDTSGSPAVSVVNRFSVSGMVMAGPFGCPGGGCTGVRVRWLEG